MSAIIHLPFMLNSAFKLKHKNELHFLMSRFGLFPGKHYHSSSLGPRASWCRVVYLDRIGCRRCNKKPPGNNTGEHDTFNFCTFLF